MCSGPSCRDSPANARAGNVLATGANACSGRKRSRKQEEGEEEKKRKKKGTGEEEVQGELHKGDGTIEEHRYEEDGEDDPQPGPPGPPPAKVWVVFRAMQWNDPSGSLRESDNIVVPPVPKSDTREAGQGLALPAGVIRLARDAKRLLVSRSRARR